MSAWENFATWAAAVICLIGLAGCLYALLDPDNRNLNYLPYLLAILFAMPFYAVSFIRMRRAHRRRRVQPQLLTIRHPYDEAIAFLQHVERMSIQPFPRGSLARAAASGASAVGVLATLVMFVFYLPQAIGDVGSPAGAGPVAVALMISAYAALLAGTWFALAYLATRLAALVVLEGMLRGFLNRKVGGLLKGLALGRDGGLNVGDASAQPHHFGAVEIVLDGAVAQRMADASNDAARRLFDKYRSSLFSVGADAGNAIIELAQDAMTWDSLIHTTYFDQAEVGERIADHILAAERA